MTACPDCCNPEGMSCVCIDPRPACTWCKGKGGDCCDSVVSAALAMDAREAARVATRVAPRLGRRSITLGGREVHPAQLHFCEDCGHGVVLVVGISRFDSIGIPAPMRVKCSGCGAYMRATDL